MFDKPFLWYVAGQETKSNRIGIGESSFHSDYVHQIQEYSI